LQLITNKRQRVAAVPSASGGKNPGNKKKARALERQHGQKNKAEAADAPTDRFQQTVRCSLGEVREAVKLLQECHRVKVREAGFGCVFDWVLEGNVSRVLMCHLMTKIDTSTMKIQCGSGKILDVNREAVHHVFGFPIGGDTAPRPSDSGHGASLAKLKEELGFERTGSIETKDLRSLLAKLVKDGTKIDLAVKVFFSILYNKLICPGSTVRLGREAAMLVDMNYKKMATMDFCQLVVDDLKRAAEKYQNSDVYQAGLEGCGVILVVMYLDSCYSVNHSVMHRRTPRASFLHQKPLRDIYNLDQIRSGGSDLSAYIFGKLAVSDLLLISTLNSFPYVIFFFFFCSGRVVTTSCTLTGCLLKNFGLDAVFQAQPVLLNMLILIVNLSRGLSLNSWSPRHQFWILVLHLHQL
jgi:hypothetical protein